MKKFIAIAFGFYVLSTALGLLLRVSFVQPVGGIVFGHALHAHSHTLYFGWGGLCLAAAWFWRTGRAGVAQVRALWALVAIAAGTFAAFLHSGYALPGIVVSTLALVVWGVLAVLLWRAAAGAEPAARPWLKVAVGYLALAVLSATARAALLAAKVDDPVWAGLAVFGFVHNFAWFLFLGAAGLLQLSAADLGLRFEAASTRRALRVLGGFAWLTVPLGVAGAQGGLLGLLARVGAAGVAVAMVLWAVALWRAAAFAPPRMRVATGWLSLWSLGHAVGSAGGAAGIAPLATAIRHPTIIYLHVFLVGAVTFGLFASCWAAWSRRPLPVWAHNLSLALMLLGLGMASGRALSAAVPLAFIGWGLWVAVAGAAGLVAAGLFTFWRLLPALRGVSLDPAHPAARPASASDSPESTAT